MEGFVKKILKTLLIIGIFAVIVSPVLGKTGGIKVDSDILCEVHREDNTIRPGCASVIWLNLQQDTPGSYTCEICDSGDCVPCSGFANDFASHSCDDGYFRSTFFAPSGTGSRTVVLYDSNGDNVGRDSFRLVESADCPLD